MWASIITQAVLILLKFLLDVKREDFELVKVAVKQADTLDIPGRSDDDAPDKDSFVRGSVKDQLKDLAPHVIDWLIATCVALLKKKLLT